MNDASKRAKDTPLSRIGDQDLVRDLSFIAGQWRDAASGDRIDVRNPADGSIVGRVAALNAEESRAAVDAAQASLGEWWSPARPTIWTAFRCWRTPSAAS